MEEAGFGVWRLEVGRERMNKGGGRRQEGGDPNWSTICETLILTRLFGSQKTRTYTHRFKCSFIL